MEFEPPQLRGHVGRERTGGQHRDPLTIFHQRDRGAHERYLVGGHGVDLDLGKGEVRQAADARAPGHGDERMAGQRLPAQFRLRRRKLLGARDGDEVVHQQVGRTEFLLAGHLEAEREVGLARLQRVDHRIGDAVANHYADVRIGRAETGKGFDQQGGGERGQGGHGDASAAAMGVIAQLRQALVDLPGHAARELQQLLPRRAELDLSGRAMKQCEFEVLLELLDQNAERGLRQRDPGGRRRKTPLLGDGDERVELAHV